MNRNLMLLIMPMVAVVWLTGCGGEKDCRLHASTFCTEGISYWADSCGELHDIKEHCSYGCLDDHSDCQPWECDGTQECIQMYGPDFYCDLVSRRCVRDVCQPACVGKCCGSDGCGGQCPNNCPGGMACESGSCSCVNICTPNCQGKECGPDGCGNVCGSCPTGEFCDNGICSSVCGPSTCPHGCCSGSICQAGNSNSACGRNGQSCDVCTGSDTCVSGVCTTPVDPCDGVTPEGHCLTSTVIEYCFIPSGGGTPSLETYTCPQGYLCQIQGGWAECVVSNECADGETECQDSSSINVCVNGSWQWQSCPGDCIQSPLGDYCAPDVNLETVQKTFSYEAKGPNSSMTNWGSIYESPAQGFIVTSINYGPNPPVVYDTQITDSQGNVSIQIPATPGPDDYFEIYAAGERSNGELAFVVANPDLSQGTQEPGSLGTEPHIWAWGGRIQDLTQTGIIIPASSGSGAARVFDFLRFVYQSGEGRWPGSQPGPLVIWIGMGVKWECGACFGPWPVHQFNIYFDSQIWIGGGSDEDYWSDAVTSHELGHWVMQTFGSSPNEGGAHCMGVPTLPGQAWSEGFATWFSSDARENPVHYDKQDGSFYWFNIDTRQYPGGYPWERPQPAWGLLQDMDENEVAAMLWELSSNQGLGHNPLDTALASNRMNDPPYARGYNRHIWEVNDQCQRINETELNESVPMVADFFDALVCGGVSTSDVDAATEPQTHYPYPSQSPICQRLQTPIRAAWEVVSGQPLAGTNLRLGLRIERRGNWPIPVRLHLIGPSGAEITRGLSRAVLPANFDAAAGRQEVELKLDRIPDQDLMVVLDSQIEGAGLHAEIPYRFGRPAPTVWLPERCGPRARYKLVSSLR